MDWTAWVAYSDVFFQVRLNTFTSSSAHMMRGEVLKCGIQENLISMKHERILLNSPDLQADCSIGCFFQPITLTIFRSSRMLLARLQFSRARRLVQQCLLVLFQGIGVVLWCSNIQKHLWEHKWYNGKWRHQTASSNLHAIGAKLAAASLIFYCGSKSMNNGLRPFGDWYWEQCPFPLLWLTIPI